MAKGMQKPEDEESTKVNDAGDDLASEVPARMTETTLGYKATDARA